MEFVCRVGTPTGEVVERTFAPPTRPRSAPSSSSRGSTSSRSGAASGCPASKAASRKVDAQILMIFGQELAALLKAGLPLFQSLDVMLERQRDPVFRRSLTTVRDKVKSGAALSEAFRAEGDLYPPIFAASLVAGERSGSLETVLRRFVQHLRLNQALKKKAVSASVYPASLLVMMMGLDRGPARLRHPAVPGLLRGPGGRAAAAHPGPHGRGRRRSAPTLVCIVSALAGVVVLAVSWWRRPGLAPRSSTACCCACPTSAGSCACTPRASSCAPSPPCSRAACPS